MSKLGARALRSAIWSAGGALLMRSFGVIVGIIAARLLTPHQFGLFAVTVAVTALLVILSDLGLITSLVRQDDVDAAAPTAMTVAIASYLLLALVMWLTAPELARQLGAPEAVGALRVMSLFLVLSGPAIVPMAVLTRDLRQDVKSKIEFVALFANVAVLLGLALNDYGELALAWSRVAGQLVVMTALVLVVRPRYRPGFNPAVARRLIVFGGPMVSASLVGSAITGLDAILIGRINGPSDLGIYNLGLAMSAWPVMLFMPIIHTIGLPLLVRIRHSPQHVGSLLTHCFDVLMGIFWPASVVLAAMSPWIVEVLYGAKWHATASVAALLCFYSFAQMVGIIGSHALSAVGRVKLLLGIQLGWLAMLFPALFAAIQWRGIHGVAVGHIVVIACLVVPAYVVSCLRTIPGTEQTDIWHARVPLVTGVIAALGGNLTARSAQQPALALAEGLLVAAVVYVALTYKWGRRSMRNARELYAQLSEFDDLTNRAPAD